MNWFSLGIILASYIKKQISAGLITKSNTKGQFYIINRKALETIILPIFDKYPLLISKYFSYLRLKKLYILNDITLTKENIDIKLLKIKVF